MVRYLGIEDDEHSKHLLSAALQIFKQEGATVC
jgi:hypothetical protein